MDNSIKGNMPGSSTIPSKISVGNPHASVSTAKTADNGSGSTPGSAVKGFSSQGVLPAKIKI